MLGEPFDEDAWDTVFEQTKKTFLDQAKKKTAPKTTDVTIITQVQNEVSIQNKAEIAALAKRLRKDLKTAEEIWKKRKGLASSVVAQEKKIKTEQTIVIPVCTQNVNVLDLDIVPITQSDGDDSDSSDSSMEEIKESEKKKLINHIPPTTSQERAELQM